MEGSQPDLEVHLLGPPAVIQRGEVVSIPRRKAQALLYYLVSDQRAHARDTLATLLWEGSDDTRARRNLSNAITALRRALGTSSEGRSYLLAEGDTLRFNTALDYRLDAALFDHLATTALKEVREQEVPLPAACGRLKEAVDLYRGDFLEGFTLEKCLAFQNWVSYEQQRLLNLLTEALQVLGEYHERRGEHRQAAAFVARLSQIDDWSEDLHQWLMRLYYLDGDRAAALRQYELCQQILEREEMTVASETEALYQRILQQERIPHRRERYERREELGRGRMGVVYRAWDVLLEREVALKVLSKTGLEKKTLARFRREARALARLKHPNIVTLHDMGERQGVLYIAMELVEGQSLRQLLRPDIPQAVDVAVQICAALEHAHQQGVIHRDIRPANVMVTPQGRVKVLDFGLARILDQASLTGSGELKGTPLYTAPELIRGEKADERADLYSLGVVLYELVAGQPPFRGDLWAVLHQQAAKPPSSPRRFNPAVPTALEQVILQLLAKSPQERFPSAAAVREALEDLLERGLARPQAIAAAVSPPSPLAIAPSEVALARLIGREEEWARLEHCWQQAMAGESPLVFLCGEPGIGKTHLAQEFASHVQKQPGGATVMQGSCRESLMEVPYAPWAEALRGYLRTFPGEEIGEIAGAEAVGLVQLVPELGAWLPSPPHPMPRLGPQAERLYLFNQVADFLLRLSREMPLLLFLDDLHWADATSLHLLEHVLRQTEKGRILLLGTYRPGEVDPERPLRDVQRRIHRTHRPLTLELARLGAAEVKRLVEALLQGQEVSPLLADTIYRETEGNPFFAEEMLKALWEEGELRLAPTGWERWREGALAVPGSIQAVLNRRVDRLSDACRHALIQASAMGQEFDFDLLKVLVNLDDEGLLDLLDEALEARLVDEVIVGEGEMYRFHHALITHVLR
jgi:DNA-binding SARP family transcriptional activator